ncbi:MAG: 4-hydroxy-tetrahydrodipicolinate synthase [Pseudomonadota bacterium]
MIKGSLVALITPFTKDAVDYAALHELVEWHIDQGTHGIVPVGTTGESATLSEEEHRRVVDTAVKAVDGRVPVVAGAGSNNPHEAIAYSNYAAESGADATLHVAGYYVRPNQKGLLQHFEAVHDATELPIVVYNIPPRAVVDIEPQTMGRIAELPRVVGVKDATGDLTRPLREAQYIQKSFSYLSGEDATAVAYNASGGNGCISVTANVAPALCAAMQTACLEGDYAQAMRIQQRLLPLHLALFREPSPAGAKYAVSLLNKCSAECRLPITTLTTETKREIESAMARLELI